MNNQERLVRAKSIERRQKMGKITPEEATIEFDALLMQESSDLIYCCDTTGITAEWDSDVMLFPTPAGTPSNTGIYARGPKRGWLVTNPAGEQPSCAPMAFEHFKRGSKGHIGGPVNA